MAESSVTEEGLKAALVEKLQATHVDIEDMSGNSSMIPRTLLQALLLILIDRRLRSSLFRSNCLPTVC
jgi:hypothetical protein